MIRRSLALLCAVLLMGRGPTDSGQFEADSVNAAGVGSGRPATLGLFRPSAATFFLKNQNISGVADLNVPYGVAGDRPLVGDWNGDGRDTVGIHRQGVFYLRNANSSGEMNASELTGVFSSRWASEINPAFSSWPHVSELPGLTGCAR